MKYLGFAVGCVVGVPVMVLAGYASRILLGWLVAALIVSTALGDLANINLLSLETYRGPDRGFEINLTDLIALAIAVVMVTRYRTCVRWLPFNTLWMIALFGLGCVATLLAPDPLLGGFSLFKAIKCYLLFWVIANILRVGVPIHAVWQGFAATALLLAAVTLYQKYGLGLYRTPTLFDHSNTVPPFANLVIPAFLCLGLTDPTRRATHRAATLGGVLGLVFAVVATFSRAGIALTASVVGATLLLVTLRVRSRAVTAASVVLLLLGAFGSLPAADSLIARVREAPASSTAARDEFNAVADRMAREHLLGVGLNNFSHVLTATPRYREGLVILAGEPQGGVVHHIYRLMAAELGYLGLLVFLMTVGRFWGTAVHRGFSSRSRAGTLLVALALGSTTLHLSGLLEWTLRITPVTYMFMIVCGLTVALRDVAVPMPVHASPGVATPHVGLRR